MPHYTHRFVFTEDDSSQVTGHLELAEPLPFIHKTRGSGFYRPGKITLDGGESLEIILYHTPHTEKFIYLRDCLPDSNLLEIIGLNEEEISRTKNLRLPGQLCLGSERAQLIEQAIKQIFASPSLDPRYGKHTQQNLAVFPIAREGLKYQVAEAIFENYGFFCDEVVLDAHHVFDSSVPVYQRKVEMTLFKDKDLDHHMRHNITVAYIADSIASGLVMKEVISEIKRRFDNIQQVEVISPFATVRGLCRIAHTDGTQKIQTRVHVFETLLNALPPDYYYSAHYNIPEFHFNTKLEEDYRQWWGKDSQQNFIADTACAGYGWSEVFYSPRKQIQMMNNELNSRHNLTIRDIVRRNL